MERIIFIQEFGLQKGSTYNDLIFQPDPELPGKIHPGLDRNYLGTQKFLVGALLTQCDPLVNLKPHTVTE